MITEITSADGERPPSYGAWTPEARQQEFERLKQAQERQLIVHLCPSGGMTLCCGKTLFELPRDDRVTTDHEAVTCKSWKWPSEMDGSSVQCRCIHRSNHVVLHQCACGATWEENLLGPKNLLEVPHSKTDDEKGKEDQ